MKVELAHLCSLLLQNITFLRCGKTIFPLKYLTDNFTPYSNTAVEQSVLGEVH